MVLVVSLLMIHASATIAPAPSSPSFALAQSLPHESAPSSPYTHAVLAEARRGHNIALEIRKGKLLDQRSLSVIRFAMVAGRLF